MVKQFEDTVLSLLRSMDQRLDDVVATMTLMSDKLTEHDTQFKRIDKRFAEIDKRFVEIDKHFKKVNATLSEHGKSLEAILNDMAPEIEKRTAQGAKLKDHERRIRVLELAKR